MKPITALSVRELGDQRVYNLTVADVHTFHFGTDRLLVHNCGGIGPTYGELRKAGEKDAHHIIQHAAVPKGPRVTAGPEPRR